MMSVILKTICLFGAIFSYLNDFCEENGGVVNISDYDYPKVKDDDVYRVAIFGTNDIHGSAFPLEITHPVSNKTYKYGGLEYLASYVRILREEWEERFLWLDGGDQFQGAIESKISNGTIITEFFNALKMNASAIGNHEWDFGQPFLYDRLRSANFDYLAANLINNQNRSEFLPNTKTMKLFQVGRVKIGVIGLATVETPFTTAGDLTNVRFLEYREVVIKSSEFLRNKGADAVILTAHVGMRCPNQYDAKMKLRIWEETTHQIDCQKEDEISVLVSTLEEGLVDAVVGGHIHDVAHHWVNGIPILQNINGGYYSNVLYLAFDKETKKLIRNKIQIEGPLPTCEKIFEKTKRCEFVTKTEAANFGELKPFAYHDKLVQSDQSVEILFQKWWELVKEYKVKIGFTEGELKKSKLKEITLGNLVADAFKEKANADISIINDGSLRNTWFPGNIMIEHLFNMFPFENNIVSFEMTGKEVKKMMGIIQAGKKGFYHTSGLMQTVNSEPKRSLVSIKLFNGSEIDDQKTYTIATNDFLQNGGDDFKDVVSWYKSRNSKQFGYVRDYMIEYIKKIDYIKENAFIDPSKPRLKIVKNTRNLQ